MNPGETFRQTRDDDPYVLLTYFCALLMLNVILSALIETIFGIGNMQLRTGLLSGAAIPVMIITMVMVCSLILTLFLAAWIHLWVYIFGGRKGIMQTFKAILYGDTPFLLLGWIPLIGNLFALWSLVLGILGICELQELSIGKAILAVAAAIITILIPLALLIAWLMSSNMVFLPVPFSWAG
ncbi:MAG: YIP1 family protein [Methanoregula sp.]|nr:YIP1 family protein [Methanoregula sp.]